MIGNTLGRFGLAAGNSAVAFVLIALVSLSARGNPEIPGAPQTKPVALIGGTVHTVSGGTLDKATVVFRDGKISAIGADVSIPPEATRIDVTGKHVYPGLFDAYSDLGLVEVNAVRATRDYREAGSLNPNVKAQVAFNPDSELIPVTRSNGVLLVVSAPNGGLVSGKSAVMQLDGWTWEEMTLQADVGMHVDWPTMSVVSDWLRRGSSSEQNADRDAALRSLQQAFDDARAYGEARRAGDHAVDSRWEAMQPVLEGKLPLIVAANSLQEIQAAVAFCDREGVRMILYGGYDAPHCAQLLKEHDVPVIIAGVYRLPIRRFDAYDDPFTLPARLREAGIPYCISGSERTANIRNLPHHAAMATAFGLPKEEALRAITLYPAEILGVDQRVGSLDVGKDATLFVSDGDMFQTKSLVERAFVQGREVELNDRHKRLWRKYEEKYRRQSE